MSLPKRAEKYRQEVIKKEISLIATQEDIKALQQAMKETGRMFNFDINKKNDDLPARITIDEDIDPEPTMYPRTSAYLRKLSKALEQASTATGEGPISVGSIRVEQMPLVIKRGVARDTIVGVMENILHGSQENKGWYNK
jgi:hypothetical protein